MSAEPKCPCAGRAISGSPADCAQTRNTLAVPRHPSRRALWRFFHLALQSSHCWHDAALQHRTTFYTSRTRRVETLYFEAIPGIPAEFAFDAATVRTVKASGGEAVTDAGVLYLTGIKAGIDSSIDVVSAEGKSLRLVVLTSSEAEDAWKLRIGGSEHLLITEQDFLTGPNARPEPFRLHSIANPHFEFSITPPPSITFEASVPLNSVASSDRIATFTADVPQWHAALQSTEIQPDAEAPPVKTGPTQDWRPHGVAQAPAAGELPQAAQWSIAVPAGALNGLSELFLEVNYEGDLARLSANHRLLDDDFYNGEPWSVGLSRFLAPDGSGNFDLSILPLRKDAPVYFELPQPSQFGPNGQIDNLDSIRLVPEYQLVVTTGQE